MNLNNISDYTALSVRQRIQSANTKASETPEKEFKELFDETSQTTQTTDLSFSKHASKRMDQRGIALDENQMSDLELAVEKAREKGAKEVAVIGSQGVFIVNVTNNVVVTTMAQEEMKQKILTNIDGAVIM